jgi:hypothetical protein
MTRWTDAALKAALQEQRGNVALFLRLVFSTTTFRYTSIPAAAGLTYAWTPPGGSSEDWVNPGGLLLLTVPTESSIDAGRSQLDVTLSLTDALTAACLNEYYVNRDISLYAALLDSNGAPISPGMTLFRGLMNGGWVLTESRPPDGPIARTARVTGISRVAEMEEIRGLTTSPYVHKLVFSGDKFFEFVAYNVNRTLRWKERS